MELGGELLVEEKFVRKKYLVEEKQLVEEKVWIGRACISHIVSSQPLVSASWSSPRLFAAFFRLIQSDKTFAVFRFGRLLFFHIFLQHFWLMKSNLLIPQLEESFQGF